jgi:twitching motility protein PilU
VEVLLNQGLIKNLIQEGKIKEIKDCIEKGQFSGMQTFDQALMDMYDRNIITQELALAESDNPANLRLIMRQKEMSTRTVSLRAAPAPTVTINTKNQF